MILRYIFIYDTTNTNIQKGNVMFFLIQKTTPPTKFSQQALTTGACQSQAGKGGWGPWVTRPSLRTNSQEWPLKMGPCFFLGT